MRRWYRCNIVLPPFIHSVSVSHQMRTDILKIKERREEYNSGKWKPYRFLQVRENPFCACWTILSGDPAGCTRSSLGKLSGHYFPSISNKGCARPGVAPCYLHLPPHLCSAGRLSVISLLTFHHSVGGTQSESGDEEKIKEVGTELTRACVVRCDWDLEAELCFMKLRANFTLQTKRMETMRGTRGNWMFEEGKWQPGRERLGHNLARSHSEIISGPQHIAV